MTRDGNGLAKIRAKLNAEGIPGPRGAWAITGVREVLNRRDYTGTSSRTASSAAAMTTATRSA